MKSIPPAETPLNMTKTTRIDVERQCSPVDVIVFQIASAEIASDQVADAMECFDLHVRMYYHARTEKQTRRSKTTR